jgi:hypothetical protein
MQLEPIRPLEPALRRAEAAELAVSAFWAIDNRLRRLVLVGRQVRPPAALVFLRDAARTLGIRDAALIAGLRQARGDSCLSVLAY